MMTIVGRNIKRILTCTFLTCFALAFDIPKIEIGMGTWYNQITTQPKGLTVWSESKYYQSDISTDLIFDYAMLFGPYVKIEYKNIDIKYQYYSNGIDFLELYFSEYISKDGYKTVDNKIIHSLGADSKIHNLSIKYEINKNLESVFMFSKRKNSIGPTGSYVIIGKNYGDFFSSYELNSFGLGPEHRLELVKNKISLVTKAIYYPTSDIKYTYQTESHSTNSRDMKGRSYLGVVELVYDFKNFAFILGYQYNYTQSNDKLFQDNLRGVTAEIHVSLLPE